MSEDKFYEELERLHIDLSIRQKEQFQLYYKLLVEWNKKINLTSITEKDQVYLKHFYDSATLAKVIDFNTVDSLCDIGTGAGFPGMVLKILYPKIKITLVDSLQKRITFLNEVIQQLKIERVKVVHERAEEYARNHLEVFDVVTSRAVSSLSVLLEISVPMIKIGGLFVPMKGDIAQEIKASKTAIEKMNVKLLCKEEFFLPIENSKRTILKFEKMKITSVKYPRKFSDIKKRPL